MSAWSSGGWTRQVTVRELGISKNIAGVNMRFMRPRDPVSLARTHACAREKSLKNFGLGSIARWAGASEPGPRQLGRRGPLGC